MREEATLLEVGEQSYHIRFKNRKEYGSNNLQTMWVHPAVITDVIKRV